MQGIKRFRLFAFGIFLIISVQGYGQVFSSDSLNSKIKSLEHYLLYRNHDTTYIKSYADQFALKLIAVNKINYFSIRDRETGASLRYRPEYGVNLGLGFSYKWFALDLAFNFGLHEDKNINHSENVDFQGRIFSSKQFIEVSFQYYYAYQLGNISGIDGDFSDIQKIRNDIRTISFGLQYLYAFNYDKFSLKAPFVLNEVQLKSAGSPILGASFEFFSIVADSSMVPVELEDHFNPDLYLTDISAASLALNIGYIYTFTWKKRFFFTLGLIPGFNISLGDSKAYERDVFKWNISYNIKSMNAFGYNYKSFFTGIQFLAEWNDVRLKKNLHTLSNHSSLKLFIGYRFRNKKKKSSG